MAKAKSPRPSPSTDNQVITMPEAGSLPIKKKSVSPQNSSNGASSNDLENRIRQRAFEIYVERGSAPGTEQEDWFRAEREILSRTDTQQSA